MNNAKLHPKKAFSQKCENALIKSGWLKKRIGNRLGKNGVLGLQACSTGKSVPLEDNLQQAFQGIFKEQNVKVFAPIRMSYGGPRFVFDNKNNVKEINFNMLTE